MHTLSKDAIKPLLEPHAGPCLSLYQATHRMHPDNAGDLINYKNLVRQLAEKLQAATPSADHADLLAPLHELAQDREFWNHTLDGLAILRAPDFLRIFVLARPVPNLAIVSDTWHVKPLLRQTQTAGRFQVLCLTRDRMWLCEGNRDEMHALQSAPEVPQTIQDALGDQLTEPYQKVSSYGMGPAGGRGHATRHGHGNKSDELQVDTPRFFRVVDGMVLKHHSRPSGLPLVLASLAEHQAVFRKLSGNPFLLPEGIELDPGLLDMEDLRARAWKVIEPHYHQETRALVDRFRAQHGTGLATDDLQKVADATLAGRVQALLVDVDRHIPGKLDAATRQVQLPQGSETLDADDILDDLAEAVLRQGGEVLMIPGDVMPGDTGVAAILRY